MKLPRLALFEDLTPAEHAVLERVAASRALLPGETLFEEGEASNLLGCVVSGCLEIVKQVPDSTAIHRIHELGPGEPVGEIAVFDRRPRSARVRALEPSVVLLLPNDAVLAAPSLMARLGERLAARLRRSSEGALDAAQQRASMGTLVVKIIMLLCGYALLLAALPGLDLGATSTSYLSLPIIAIFGFGAWRFIRSTRYPLSKFGLGLRNLPLSIVEAAVLTPLFCALLVALKWIAMRVHAPWRELPLFERLGWEHLLEPAIVKLLALYFVSSAVQELIVRSALQASLEEFLVGPNRRRATLLVCALMFAVNHLHMSFVFAAFAFVPGLFWGWLFQRRRHLAGPVLSHFAVGAFVFFVLGVSLP